MPAHTIRDRLMNVAKATDTSTVDCDPIGQPYSAMSLFEVIGNNAKQVLQENGAYVEALRVELAERFIELPDDLIPGEAVLETVLSNVMEQIGGRYSMSPAGAITDELEASIAAAFREAASQGESIEALPMVFEPSPEDRNFYLTDRHGEPIGADPNTPDDLLRPLQRLQWSALAPGDRALLRAAQFDEMSFVALEYREEGMVPGVVFEKEFGGGDLEEDPEAWRAHVAAEIGREPEAADLTELAHLQRVARAHADLCECSDSVCISRDSRTDGRPLVSTFFTLDHIVRAAQDPNGPAADKMVRAASIYADGNFPAAEADDYINGMRRLVGFRGARGPRRQTAEEEAAPGAA